MAKLNAAHLAFNRGEVSKTALARIDVAKLQLAAECQLNWRPRVVGSMELRPGLQKTGQTRNDQQTRLVDFVFSKTDTALLELTNLAMRVYIGDTLLTRPSVTTAIGDSNFTGTGAWSTTDTTPGNSVIVAAGLASFNVPARGGIARIKQTVTVILADQNVEHGLRVVVQNGPVTLRVGSTDGTGDLIASTSLDTGTHSLSFTPTGASFVIQIESVEQRNKLVSQCSIETAGAVSVTTPWATSALSSLRWTQSGDTIYVAQYGGQPYKIERRGARPGARGWSVSKYLSNNGPFQQPATNGIKLTPGGYSGNTTLTADKNYFIPSHVGCLFRLFTFGQANDRTIGAAFQATEPIRVSGVGNDRKFGVRVANTFGNNITVERSLVGPDVGFVPYTASNSVSATIDIDDTSTLNNVTAWYRVRTVQAADYNGIYTIFFGQNSLGSADPFGSTTAGAAASAGGRWGICRVTSYVSPTQVNVEVIEDFSSIQQTDTWQQGIWSDADGWPTSVCFYEDRLFWLNGPYVIGSESNAYTSFAAEDSSGQSLGDSGAIIEGYGDGPFDSTNWGLPLQRLLCGREQSIASVRSSNFDTPLTPTDISVKDCSDQGAARLPPVKMGKRAVFVQQNGQRVYELSYQAALTDYADRDLTRLNIDIGSPGFVDVAGSAQPDGTVYLVRSTGDVACLLYDIDDEVEAWWRISTLGVIENVAVLPPSAGMVDDQVYFVVKRTVNGATRRFIEKMAQSSNCVGGLLNQQLDCHLSYSGAPTANAQLDWLPNTAVMVWADGAFIGSGTTNGSGIVDMPDGNTHSNIVVGLGGSVQTYSGAAAATMTGLSAYEGYPCEVFADQQPSDRMVHVKTLTVSGGAISLPNGTQSANIVACFGYVAPFMSAKLGYGAMGGTPLNQRKKIDQVGLILYDTHNAGLQFGQRFDVLDTMPSYEGDAAVPSSTVWSQYDEQMITVPGEWHTDGRLCLLGQAPYPCKVGAAVMGMQTSG